MTQPVCETKCEASPPVNGGAASCETRVICKIQEQLNRIAQSLDTFAAEVEKIGLDLQALS